MARPLGLSRFAGMMLPENGWPVVGSMIVRAAGEEPVVRVEQLAEVAGAHQRGRNGGGVGLDREEIDPFLRREEEQLVLQLTHRDGATDRVRVLLVVERGRSAVLERVRAPVSSPRVRLQLVVAHEVRRVAAEAAATALRDDADLAAARAPVLGHVVAGQNLDFLDRVHVLNADDGARSPRADRRRAVDGDVVLVAAAAVDAEASVGEAGEAVVVEAPADDARLQPGDANRVAAVEGDLLDVLRLDRFSQRGIALQRRLFGGDGHLLGQRAGFKREVERERAGGVELHVGAGDFLEAAQLDRELVPAGRQVGKCVEAAAVGDGRAGLLRLGARDGHGRAGDDATL